MFYAKDQPFIMYLIMRSTLRISRYDGSQIDEEHKQQSMGGIGMRIYWCEEAKIYQSKSFSCLCNK